jgi:hypothetical protein
MRAKEADEGVGADQGVRPTVGFHICPAVYWTPHSLTGLRLHFAQAPIEVAALALISRQ